MIASMAGSDKITQRDHGKKNPGKRQTPEIV